MGRRTRRDWLRARCAAGLNSLVLWSSVGIGAASIAAQADTGAGGQPEVAPVNSSAFFPTRDEGKVNVDCNLQKFIVSLDRDDDDLDGVEDHRRAPSPQEDNLREFVFLAPGAASVFIAEPMDSLSGNSALPFSPSFGMPGEGYIEAYQSDKRTKFVFNRIYPVPARLFVRGLKKSPTKDHIRFELQFLDAAGTWLACGQGVHGHVVDVAAGLAVAPGAGAKLDDHHKMLITGSGNADATVQPATSGHDWSYTGGGQFDDPTALSTVFRAGTTPTPHGELDQHDVECTALEYGLEIVAHYTVNLTAPTHLEVLEVCLVKSSNQCAKRGHTGFWWRTDWLKATPGTFDPMPKHTVKYQMLDQWGGDHSIQGESAYGGAMPQKRDNMLNVLTSPILPVQAWIPIRIQWTPTWEDEPDGVFRPTVEASGMDKDLIVVTSAGQRSFHPSLRAVGGVLMQTAPPHHQWLLSVNGQNVTAATNNVFESRVVSTRQGGRQIRFRTTYRIVLTTPPAGLR